MKIMTDSPIRFPGLFGDWAITISSKAIDIGNGIYWYGILIALGMLVALWWCMRQRTKYGIREDDLIDGLLWGIPSAIVGARLYYVLFYLSEFKDHEGHFSWSKAIAIWDGGLAIYGGVIAVNTATFIGQKRRGIIGGIVATLGVVFPSLIIIAALAGVIDAFSHLAWVQHAFAGIRVCVCVLIFNAVLKLWKGAVKDVWGLVIFLVILALSVFTKLSPIIYVLAAAVAGLLIKNLGAKRS